MARFRVRQYKGQAMSAFYWEMVSVKNLSAGGLLFYYNRNLGFDSLLDLKIDIFHVIPTIHCVGKVVRVEEAQPHSLFRIAASFTELSSEQKELINKTVVENLKI